MLEKQNSEPWAIGLGSAKGRGRAKIGDLDSLCNSKTITQDCPDFLGNKEKTSSCFSIKEGQKAKSSLSDMQSSGSHDRGSRVQPDALGPMTYSVGEEMKQQAVEHGENDPSLLGLAACLSLNHVERPLIRASKDYVGSPAESKPAKVSEPCSKRESVADREQLFQSAISVDLTLGLPVAFQDHMTNNINMINGSSQEEVASNRKQDHLGRGRSSNYVRSRKVIDTDGRASECGSCTGPSDDTDSLRVWKAMKQNGFLSSQLHAPLRKRVLLSNSIPSKRLKPDLLKKNIELAKREQVDRFTKIAAPSGLLTELNPGIINHVRNSKQVQSIIEALVKSKKLDSSQTQTMMLNQLTAGSNEINESKKDSEGTVGRNTNCVSVNGSSAVLLGSDDHVPVDFFTKAQPKHNAAVSTCSWSEQEKTIEQETLNKAAGIEAFVDSQFNLQLENMLSSMLRKGQMTVEKRHCLSNEGPLTDHDSLIDLSIKAAFVAREWLELLSQDISGRLSALRRSKKRIQTVMQNELPSIMSRDFLPRQENDSDGGQSPGIDCSNKELPQNHLVRWRSLFDQMEKALQQEGKYLESWLKQVKEMQAHCQHGLHGLNMERVELPVQGNNSRSKKDDTLEGEFAVRAAAASIYSTCNFALSNENIRCF